VQDRFGSNPAYPTFRAAHGLARHITIEGERLPMKDVMADRAASAISAGANRRGAGSPKSSPPRSSPG
jgi:hypothetical protein